MVIDRLKRGSSDDGTGHGRDRGQVILIGAITLAFIILGMVVIVNGVLYTGTLASGSSGQSGTEAETVDGELDQGIGGIAHRGNLEWGESGYDQYNQTIRDVVEDEGFRERYRNVTANSRPAVVNVTVDGVDPSDQARARVGENVSNSPSFSVDQQVGHLVFHLESDEFGNVTVNKNGTSPIEINETEVDGSPGFEITDANGDTCEVANESARINLVTGAVNVTVSDECDRQYLDPSKPVGLLEFDSESAEGSYDLVVRNDAAININTAVSLEGNDYPAAWAVNVTVTYESNDVSYERTQRVVVYGDPS